MPDWLFAGPILLRGTLIWGSSRIAMAMVTWLMNSREEPLTFGVTPGAAAWLILVVGALGLVEVRRRNEHLLLANMGCAQGTLAAIAAIPALLGEAAIALALLGADGAPRS